MAGNDLPEWYLKPHGYGYHQSAATPPTLGTPPRSQMPPSSRFGSSESTKSATTAGSSMYHPIMPTTPHSLGSTGYYPHQEPQAMGANPTVKKLEMENNILKQRISSLERELEELRFDVSAPADTSALDHAQKQWQHYQQAYEHLSAAVAVVIPQQLQRTRVTESGSINPEQLAHKIKVKLDMLTADNHELLQMCAASTKSSLMAEVALLQRQVATASQSLVLSPDGSQLQSSTSADGTQKAF